ncbi:3'-5' exonuclease [Bifidobacterium platyrrhinorum]|uniref:3'-5' exonuclease n=1 Tax=Bifidobacterium platyrrhinorum TaxID=2661628 RepID=A0A6L9SVP3_9BIFI|nr:3'-5' exonuclease [Bifidobacterium platyrrhinorum]NEG56209.1 3'-5' exonuclease [Bifidobacterium platyrrhinorum]
MTVAGIEGFPTDYVALDLETTGFYPNSCAITEIGAVRVRDRRIVDRFQRLVNPLKPIPAAVVRLTGITDDMVAGLDPIDQVLPEFVAWLGQGADAESTGDGTAAAAPGITMIEPLIGHNIRFDLGFLDWNARKVLDGPFSCVDFDTMQISRTLFSHERHHRLLDLIQRFDIADNEEHRALSDAIQTQQCFEWLHKYVDRHAGRGGFGTVDWKTVPTKNNDAILNRQIILL